VNQLQSSFSNELIFVPNRGDFARGILQPYTQLLKKEELVTKYETFIKISLL
jgi:N-acetyl-gamma-glutamyl-phosphate reductase